MRMFSSLKIINKLLMIKCDDKWLWMLYVSSVDLVYCDWYLNNECIMNR